MVIEIREGGLDDARVVGLLAIHVSRARGETAEGSAHALDVSGLRVPGIWFWAAWEGESVVGTVALKRLTAEHGEIKSMHTAEAFRRRGVASAMLRHVMAVARAEGMGRVSLETGSWDYFLRARRFYARHGFRECGPFGEYVEDRNSVFMTVELGPNREDAKA
jgi:putative acetyltransferase